MTVQQTRTCEKCGGTITAEEIIQRRAGLVEKKLLCVACVDALRRQVAMARAATAQKAREAEEQAVREAEERAAQEQAAREAEERAVREAEAREAEERAAREAAELAAREQAEAEAAIRAAEEAALTALAAEAALKPALDEEYTEAAAEEPLLEPTFESAFDSVVSEPHTMNGTRCLIFDAEPSSSGIAELQMRINRWLAEHPDAVVKSSSTTLGPCNGAGGGTRFFVTMFF